MKDPLIENIDEKARRTTTLILTNRNFSIPIEGPNPYVKNSISTSKYNSFTFLPKNLLEQFQKLANVYFVIIAVLQAIPDISNSGGVPTILLPLGLVLAISAVKDYLEDRKREKSDNEENNRKALIRKNGAWIEILWKEIRVGDIIKVTKDEKFPADIIFLSCSDDKGICYVETKNLDGETNLKHKVAFKYTQALHKNDEKFLDSIIADIKCEDPNPMIYQFSGIMKISQGVNALSSDQFLLRGTSLKNTDWIVGLVIYTGHESKIMLNSSKSKVKYSSNEKQMNDQIVYLFFLQLVFCGFCAIFYVSWMENSINDTSYLELDKSNTNSFYNFVVVFFSWMLLFSNFVPISLLVTLELVKFIQAIYISWDLDMYYEENDMPAGVQSSNLNEELGQVQYLFSDKTGTLTCNIMEFRKITIRGQSYGSDTRQTQNKIPYVDFLDERFDPKNPNTFEFLIHLACCHTIISEFKDGNIEYKANSPDELALANAAKYFGYEFIDRDKDQNIELKVFGQSYKVNLLNIIEFNSDRKRMTVVVKLPDNKIKVLCKGADSVMLPRLISDSTIDQTLQNLENYGNQGLRTLLIATRDISEKEYAEWNALYVEAMQDIRNRDKRIAECGELIETSMTLLGATAIEDRLQDDVPHTIEFLREAGIKIWVLTGDKIETAVNIGFSCNLLTNSMEQIMVTSIKTKDIEDNIDNGLSAYRTAPNKEYALVVSGDSILKIKDNILKKFVTLCELSQVVIACRVSPQQKADIVRMIRSFKPNARTLSIGDGANDVNMISAAHVGVGIAGLEGKQAVRASDYSIAQFSYLKKLLFVHGRECYRRNSILICYNFYKNVLVVMPLFFFGMFSVFSGEMFYNVWVYQMFNLTFASLPIIIYAIFDKEMPFETLLSDPSHYEIGIKGELFSTQKFWEWIFEASVQSVLILIISIFGICEVSGSKNSGKIDSLSVASVMVFGLIVIFSNVKVFLFSYSHSILSLSILLVSILSYYFISAIITEWLPIWSVLDNFNSYGATSHMFYNPNSYIIVIVVVYSGFFVQPLITFALSALKMYEAQTKKKLRNHEISMANDLTIEEERKKYLSTKHLRRN